MNGDRRMVARRDMAVVIAISAAAAVLCIRFDLSEIVAGWTRPHESLQLDELPAVLLVFAVCLIWFSSRRFFEARRQLDFRHVVEARLEDALAENQRLARQCVAVQEAERKALARDLHDELGQYLNVIKLDAVSIRDAALPALPPIRSIACAVIDNVDRVYAVVANLIRQLRPAGFDELGLAAALEHCVNDWRIRLPGIDIRLSIDAGFAPPDEPRALALFRLVQEAMTNVARHARATRVEILIERRRGSNGSEIIGASIADDGTGVDLNSPRGGLGLVGMRERVAAFGGTLELTSHPGRGFNVLAWMPTGDSPMPGRVA